MVPTLVTRRDAVKRMGAAATALGAMATAARAFTSPAESKIAIDGGNIAYWIVGEGRGVPLLTVHGGPGASHLLLTPLSKLGADRPVIFFDQLDCGDSDHPDKPSAWTVDGFASQIEAVRAGLGLQEFHLLGSSAGGCFASEYAARRPDGLKSCIFAGPSINNPQFTEDVTHLVKLLPEDAATAIIDGEAAGTVDHNEKYDAASKLMMHRHLCRVKPWPADFQKSQDTFNWKILNTMFGPYWTKVGGNTGAYDGTARLGRINVPVLLTYGQFDLVLGETMRGYQEAIAGSRLRKIKDGGHYSWFEAPDEYQRAVSGFLSSIG